MATTHYSLPTIVGTDTVDGVNAINGLANAVDAALYSVAGEIPSGYVLPVATASELGGVRSGGDVTVASGTGVMSIANGVIDSNKLAANSVAATAIQNNAVSSVKLTSDVTSQIAAGYQASQKLADQPVRHSLSTTTANLFGTYVVNEAAHMVTMKITSQGATCNVSTTSHTNPETAPLVFDAIPAQYRPTTTFSAVMGLSTATSGGNGLIVWMGAIRSDGVPCVYYYNAWANTGDYQFIADCTIAWFYDVSIAD